jgi:glycine/D-amino acid oxidase-like deaminating enzyme
VTGVQTTEGPIAAEIVVNCGGQWARQVGRMVGVTVPLYSCEHMYIVTEKMENVPRDLPVMRDPDGYIYFKEEVGGLLMGGFEPEAKPWNKDVIPDDFEFGMLPGRLGPVPDPDGQRADPRPGAREDRHQDLHERAGELYTRPQLHPGRGA